MSTRTARVERAAQPAPLTGEVEGTAWAAAEPMAIDRYPWFAAGQRQATTARLLYDDRALSVQFLCEDRHISCQATELNGPVWLDSCVELFAAPRPDGLGYFNLEINACGAFLMGFGAGRHGRKLITPELAGRVEVVSSLPAGPKDDSPADAGWWAAARLPLDLLAEFTGLDVQAGPGHIWRANLYRCGGQTDPQYACWNPIAAEQPDYHRPECFGELHFA